MQLNKSILLIEDHDSFRLLLTKMLNRDYNVIGKSNAIEAYAWLSYGNIPDLIILDLHLPEISGIDFLQNIKTSGIFRDIPVFIVSADQDLEMKKQCYELNITEYFSKPFNPLDLINKLQKTLAPLKQLA